MVKLHGLPVFAPPITLSARHSLRVTVVLAGLLLLLLGAPASALAEGPITATVVRVENNFPDELIFHVEASSTAGDIKQARLHSVVGSGPAQRVGNVEFTPGPNFTAEFTYKTNNTYFVAAGADITYWLDVTDTAGNQLLTPKQRFWYEDTRFEWSSLEDGGVTVYYYGGADGKARAVLQAAKDTQTKIGTLLGLEAQPFRVMLYNSSRDIIGAQRPELSATRSRELIRVGVAYSGEDLVQVLGVGGSFGLSDTARHEIAHLFMHWAGGNNVPAWINEGLAVWSQDDPGREYRSSLQRALQANELLLIRGMDNFPGKSDQNILAYGQSWHVVNWMIETYGPEKMGRLLGAIKAGDGARRGIQDIYGLDIDQLDAKWRTAIGAPPRSYERVVPTPIALPTIPSIDTASPQQQPSRGDSGDRAPTATATGGGPPYLIIGAGVAVALLVVVGGAAGIAVARRED